MNKIINTAALVIFLTLLAGAWLLMTASSLRAKTSAASTFDAKCAACHSKDGSGSSPMGKSMKIPDLRSKAVQSKSDAELDSFITKGKGMMPAYASQLSREEINDLVAYIRHLGGKKK
ncbi:MAG: cytochrome c [Acidobacteria bacterium]|nr:MAG: cytochrome c [Acidobacteriota bacterium]